MKNLLLIMTLVTSLSVIEAKDIDLQDAIEQGIVKASVKGVGGHLGKVLALEVTNIQNRTVYINIPVGLQFLSEDEGLQDLINTQGTRLAIAAGSVNKLVLNAMCIQPSNGSPSVGSSFLVGTLATGALLELVQYISQKQYLDNLGQSAVWTLIRGEGLENVYGPDQNKLNDLLQFMSQLTDKEVPWYNKEKLPPPPGQVFSTEPSILHGIYTFHLEQKGFANLAVYDSTGKEVFLFLEHFEVLPGDNCLKFKLTVKGYKAGKYYARLFLDGVMKEEKMFEI